MTGVYCCIGLFEVEGMVYLCISLKFVSIAIYFKKKVVQCIVSVLVLMLMVKALKFYTLTISISTSTLTMHYLGAQRYC